MPNPIALYDDNISIKDVGKFVMEYESRQNAFVHSLVNRIAFVIITSKSWNSPLAWSKRGKLELGETIEEIFVNIGKTFSYDPEAAEDTWMRRELPDVRAAFHTMNFQKYYKVTIQRNDLARAFLSWGNVNELASYIVQTLYTKAEYDDFITTKYMMCRYAINGFMRVDEVQGGDGLMKTMIKKVRSNSRKMTFLKSTYNRAGVMNSSPIGDQYVFLDADTEAEQIVDVLASAFNMEKAEWVGRVQVLDTLYPEADEIKYLDELYEGNPNYEPFTDAELTTLKGIKAYVVDKSFFMIFDNLFESAQQPNGQGLYWQYWLHAWKTFSVSPFANAYVLFEGTSGVTSITLNPGASNITPGSDMTFTATVNGNGLYPKEVYFSIAAQDNDTVLESGTTIDPNTGRLHVSKGQAVGSKIVVTATASGVTKTSVVTVTE